jgi:hypothetical protein
MKIIIALAAVFASPVVLSAHEAILSLKDQLQLSRHDSASVSQTLALVPKPEALRATQIPPGSIEKSPSATDIVGAPDETGMADGSGWLLERVAVAIHPQRQDAETESLMQMFGLTQSDAENFGPALANRWLLRELFRQRLLYSSGK